MKEGQAAILDAGLRRLWQKATTAFVGRLALRPVALPPELAEVAGTLAGTPVTMRTQRYRGAQLAALTVAVIEVEQRLCSLTVIGLPSAGTHCPVLGVDLIALRGTLALVALDLAPIGAEFWSARCSVILDAMHTLASPALLPRKRPDFTAEVFSDKALIGAARVGQEEAVFAAVELLLERSAELFAPSSAARVDPKAAQRLTRWLAAERQNRKEHNALAGMFGAAFATRYLEQFLFGATAGDGVSRADWTADRQAS